MVDMSPYLSFVVAARNDNYGGDFLRRIQMFSMCLIELLLRYDCSAELIIVEWNPPPDRPRLTEAIRWPESLGRATVRVLTVPADVHRRLPNSDRMPMFEYFAKNVGIRRARGKFVLTTNPDLLYTPALIAYLAAEKLSPECYYRVDRHDFDGSVPEELAAERALGYAKRRIFRINFRQRGQLGRLSVEVSRWRRLYYLLSEAWPGSYQGYEEEANGSEPVILLDDDNGAYGGIYTNAAGDFLLASKDSWTAVRGFPEFPDTFLHLDGYACHQLRAIGLRQAVFRPPCMILHADHGRTDRATRPSPPQSKWMEDLRKIRDGSMGPALNGPSWGLVDDIFEESVIGSGA
jgi:hypothetical protein